MKPTDLTITSATVGTRVLLVAAAAIAMVAANCGSGRDSLVISGGGSGAEDAQPDVDAGGQDSEQTDAEAGTGGVSGIGGTGGSSAGGGDDCGTLPDNWTCDPITQCGCDPDEVCTIPGETPYTKCVSKGTRQQLGHPCSNVDDCAGGLCIKTVTCSSEKWESCKYTLCDKTDCESNKGTCAKYCDAKNIDAMGSCETGIDGNSSGKCLKVENYEKYLIGLCTHQCEPWNPKKTCADDVVSCDVPWQGNDGYFEKLIEGISVCNVHEENVAEDKPCTLHSDCPNETGCFVVGGRQQTHQCRHWCTDNNNCTDGDYPACEYLGIQTNGKNVGRCSGNKRMDIPPAPHLP